MHFPTCPGTCAAAQAHQIIGNSATLSFIFQAAGSSFTGPAGDGTGKFVIGEYQQGAAGTAAAEFGAGDVKCNTTDDEKANAGAVTVTSVANDVVVGSYDLTFPSGAHLTGSFSAPPCAGDFTVEPTCK